ncbi:MAG: hypothetical protein ACO1PI_02265 [Bacteroidota bacterium]
MFNNYQLQILQQLEEKWALWQQTKVSLFTHEDKLRIDELRSIIGMQPARSSCHACFMEDIQTLMAIYSRHKQSGESTIQGEAKGEEK